MISLRSVNLLNFDLIKQLRVAESQSDFVATPLEIIARAYIYSHNNSKLYAIYYQDKPIGLCLVCEYTEDIDCYELQEFFIDYRWQKQGNGSKALNQLINMLKMDLKYTSLYVSIRKENKNALNFYKKNNFVLRAKGEKFNILSYYF